MYGASGQRTPRVPSFHGNDRLKFTAEEQQAIHAAEKEYGYRPQHHIAARPPGRPRHRHGLAFTILAIVVFWILRALALSVLEAVHLEEEARESEAHVTEEVQPQTQSRAVPNSNTVIFQNQRGSAEVPRGPVPSEPIPQREYLGHEQVQPRQPLPPGSQATLSHVVDRDGRISFVND